jgi:alpha-galactosidase
MACGHPRGGEECLRRFYPQLYSILADLRAKHPNVEIESCAGGGSRVDFGIMRYTDEVWPSDNTDAFDRLLIQNGFTYAYTLGVMMSWITDSPTWVKSERALAGIPIPLLHARLAWHWSRPEEVDSTGF